MKRSEQEKFKKIFEEQKMNLLYSNSIIDSSFEIQRDDLMDDHDRTSVDLEQSMRIRLRNREALLIKKINQSLKRIQSGIFGLCEACEEEIEVKRLHARPTTTLCLSCKEEQEGRERQFLDGRRSKSMGSSIKIA